MQSKERKKVKEKPVQSSIHSVIIWSWHTDHPVIHSFIHLNHEFIKTSRISCMNSSHVLVIHCFVQLFSSLCIPSLYHFVGDSFIHLLINLFFLHSIIQSSIYPFIHLSKKKTKNLTVLNQATHTVCEDAIRPWEYEHTNRPFLHVVLEQCDMVNSGF